MMIFCGRDVSTPNSVGEYFQTRFSEWLAAGGTRQKEPDPLCPISFPCLHARLKEFLGIEAPDDTTRQVNEIQKSITNKTL